jgi:hypothetical protein
MTPPRTKLRSVLCTATAAAGLFVLPSAAAAAAGGALAAPGGAVAPADPQSGGTISAPGPVGPNTLQAPPGGTIVKEVAVLHGQLTAADARRTVLIQLLYPKNGWTLVAKSVAGPDGSFTASWRPRHIGRFQMRALPAGGASASSLAGPPTTVVDVLRPVLATFFGPGMYGSQTACGQTLTPTLLGVAHRTLPCGTLVDISYGGRTITVPVVDRGPYANGASYDLTTATARALGIDGTARIGALAIRG